MHDTFEARRMASQLDGDSQSADCRWSNGVGHLVAIIAGYLEIVWMVHAERNVCVKGGWSEPPPGVGVC